MDNQKPRHNKPMLPWEKMQLFEDGDLGVELKKLALAQPKYSITVLAKRKDGSWTPHIGVELISNNGIVSLGYMSDRVNALIREAEGVAARDAQVAENAFWDRKRERESRNMDREKPRHKREFQRPRGDRP